MEKKELIAKLIKDREQTKRVYTQWAKGINNDLSTETHQQRMNRSMTAFEEGYYTALGNLLYDLTGYSRYLDGLSGND